MTDLLSAKALLEGGDHTIVICRGKEVTTDTRRGIAPMLDFLEQGLDFCGASVADRVVGRAAAFLFLCAGVREVFAEVISEPAIEVLRAHKLPYQADRRVPYIINRAGDGPCPMEQAVQGISDPQQALAVLRARYEALTQAVGQTKKP